MFRRRRKHSLAARLRGHLWPRRGWGRALVYLGHRLRRLPGTPESIAAGFATGVALSFTPLVGLHILVTMMFAWALRANYMAGILGTFAGNPWTFPLMWMLSFRTGARLLGLAPSEAVPAEFSMHFLRDIFGFILFGQTRGEVIAHPISWAYVNEVLVLVLVPWMVGSLLCGLVAWFVVYFALRTLVTIYRHRRRQRRAARRAQRLAAAVALGAAPPLGSGPDQAWGRRAEETPMTKPAPPDSPAAGGGG